MNKQELYTEIARQFKTLNEKVETLDLRLSELIAFIRPVGTLQYNQVDPMQPHQVMRALEAQQTQSESPLNLQRQYRPSSPYQQESPVTEPHPAHGNEVMEAMKEQHREALT